MKRRPSLTDPVSDSFQVGCSCVRAWYNLAANQDRLHPCLPAFRPLGCDLRSSLGSLRKYYYVPALLYYFDTPSFMFFFCCIQGESLISRPTLHHKTSNYTVTFLEHYNDGIGSNKVSRYPRLLYSTKVIAVVIPICETREDGPLEGSCLQN